MIVRINVHIPIFNSIQTRIGIVCAVYGNSVHQIIVRRIHNRTAVLYLALTIFTTVIRTMPNTRIYRAIRFRRALIGRSARRKLEEVNIFAGRSIPCYRSFTRYPLHNKFCLVIGCNTVINRFQIPYNVAVVHPFGSAVRICVAVACNESTLCRIPETVLACRCANCIQRIRLRSRQIQRSIIACRKALAHSACRLYVGFRFVYGNTLLNKYAFQIRHIRNCFVEIAVGMEIIFRHIGNIPIAVAKAVRGALRCIRTRLIRIVTNKIRAVKKTSICIVELH